MSAFTENVIGSDTAIPVINVTVLSRGLANDIRRAELRPGIPESSSHRTFRFRCPPNGECS